MEITAQIWEWSIRKNIKISAEHVPGKLNTTADHESRLKGDSSEWMLDQQCLSDHGSSRSMSNRPVCIDAISTAPKIHELETAPGFNCYGC